MKDRGNLFEGIESKAPGPGEWFDPLLRHGPVRVERIVSHGHCAKPGFWDVQDEPEWVLVVSGHARLRLADPEDTVDLGPGDWLYLPPLRKHRVEWTTPDKPTVWLAVWPGADGGGMTGDTGISRPCRMDSVLRSETPAI